MKELEGKKIYLRPTGNNARRRGEDRIVTAHVIKVARVFVTLTLGDSTYESKFRISGTHLDGGHNSGYYFYATEEELADQLFVEKTAAKIADKYTYRRDYFKLDRVTITKVAALLEIEL